MHISIPDIAISIVPGAYITSHSTYLGVDFVEAIKNTALTTRCTKSKRKTPTIQPLTKDNPNTSKLAIVERCKKSQKQKSQINISKNFKFDNVAWMLLLVWTGLNKTLQLDIAT